jgi:hypothetical protein
MQPEWDGDVRSVFVIITAASVVAFLLMVWIFAYYM